ncbi:MAG: hypothetical protein HC913_00770 [Microscillaceae bacterium]|nr:hypothetical protein [Microscillaceae bacterium]
MKNLSFDRSRFNAWTWKHPFMLHWLLNLGLAFNELVLGQRVPKVMLIEKNTAKNLAERTFIPCPHCQTLHPGLTWRTETNTAFGNWFGLYCKHCGHVIPCLTNLSSALLLGLTFPLWFAWKEHGKTNWLRRQAKWYQNLDLSGNTNPFAGMGWIKEGLTFGLFMFVVMVCLLPWLFGEAITPKKIGIGLPIWLLGGLCYGYMMKRVNRKQIPSAME